MLQQYLLLALLLVASAGVQAFPTSRIAPVFDKTRAPRVGDVQPVVDSQPAAVVSRAQYELDTVLDYDRQFVTVDEIILYPNQSGRALRSLVLAVASNLNPNCFRLASFKIDGIAAANYRLTGQRLEVLLPREFASNASLKLELRFTLALPRMEATRSHLFGYSDLQTNLVDWYPFVVPNIDGEWVLHDPSPVGEYLTYPLADFQVNLVFADPARAPIVAASGAPEQIGAFTRYTLTSGRAFALSVSRDYKIVSKQVGDLTISSYYFSRYQRAAEAALLSSAQALQVFSDKFGPYPHLSLSIVLADKGEATEYSALNFQRRSYYDQYSGKPSDFLNFFAVHAAARQWWGEQVANDAALEPWLYESLATYSESIFYESAHPQLLKYWWANRIDYFRPDGPLNISVYSTSDESAYRRAIDYNGARFVAALRERIGDEAFFAFLRDYATRENGAIASSRDFFNILAGHSQVTFDDLLHSYFQYP